MELLLTKCIGLASLGKVDVAICPPALWMSSLNESIQVRQIRFCFLDLSNISRR